MTVQLSHLSHPKYRPDIDGLRAVAVLAVVIFHAFPDVLRGGFIGVDIFFVISGYLISTIIFENLDKNTFSFSEFYARRIRRIFPALLLVLTACFSVGWFVLLADEYKQLGQHMAAGSVFLSNFILWNESGYFDKSADTKPLLHLWSLGIEEQFYILWPFLLWFAWKQKFNLLMMTIIIAGASFALNLVTVKQDMVASFYSPLSRFWELLSGSLLAWITLYKKAIFSQLQTRWANIFSVAGVGLLILGFSTIHQDLNFPGYWALIPVSGAVLIISAGPQAWLNRLFLSNRLMTWLGLISFPLYLWHWPLLSFATIVTGDIPDPVLRIAAIALSILLAWLTCRFVERPLRFGQKSRVRFLITLMILIGCLGFYTSVRNGFTFRKADKEHNINRIGWYQGKDDWLFLGGGYDKTVAKLTLSIIPTKTEIETTTDIFSKIAQAGIESHTKIFLIVAPDKSSVYPEFLPDTIIPSSQKYSDFFLDRFKNIPNLTIYNPLNDLLYAKETQGLLYYKTDTHWNKKGAFVAYSGLSKTLGLPVPQVQFQIGSPYTGDIIGISKLKNFPLSLQDNWNIIWKHTPFVTTTDLSDQQKTSFGSAIIASNQKPLSQQSIWVVGDSFTENLKPYLNATFKEVRYIGHWKNKLKDLPADLANADKKPDMVIIVRVERSF